MKILWKLWVFIACILLSTNVGFSAYTQWDVDSAQKNLLNLQGGDVFQQRIDDILEGFSTEKKTKLQESLPAVSKKYSSKTNKTQKDTYVVAIIDYILVELWVQNGGNIVTSDTVTSIAQDPGNTEICKTHNPTPQYKDWRTGEWYIIPNVCDASIPDGVFSEYHENGKARFEIPIKDWRYDGIAKWYRTDGTLETQGNYDYWVILWEYLFYDSQGNLIQKNTYSTDNTVEVTKYYTNGGISSRDEVQNWIQHWAYETYFTNGNRRDSWTRYNGVFYWDFKIWYKNGKVKTHILDDNTIIVDNPDYKIQNGDSVVLYITVLDENGGFISNNYWDYSPMLVTQENMRSIEVYNNLIGLGEWERAEFQQLAQAAYPDLILEDNELFNTMLGFEIFVVEIERP